ncbi:ATP-binding protein [Streptomyces tailanensis]|uniref:ATP-binding protein n=1 Tax=Streptomyces tailanensis TaxID=2569858 RepID=UPI00122E8447|nr:ATP-binding protein [Streptomyces tailanensis]
MPETGDQPSDRNEPWTYTLSIPNDPRAVTICRRTLRHVLTLHGLSHLAEAAELVARELVANAVQHTKGPAAIRLHWSAPILRIGVWDTDPDPPVPACLTATTHPKRPGLENGRGLTLVKACSDRWGWYTLGSTGQPPHGNGKFVWCELARAA